MIRIIFSFTTLLFFIGTILRTLLVISATRWYIIWTGLECNLFAFIPLIVHNKLFQEKEAAIKYLFAQGVPSGFLLLSIINNNENMLNSSSIVTFLVATKLGMAPIHFWFPSVINASSWFTCWILCTIQKISPFILISQTLSPSPIIIYSLVICSSFVRGIGGMNQTLLRPLLAYSSIGHIRWALATSIIQKDTAILYFIRYTIIVSTTILFLRYLHIKRNNQISPIKTSYFLNWCVFFSLGRIRGLPPLFGFFPKIIVLLRLGENNIIFLGRILILGSLINIYYYLKIIFLSVIIVPPSFFYPRNKQLYFFIYFTIAISFTSISFSLLLLIFFIF